MTTYPATILDIEGHTITTLDLTRGEYATLCVRASWEMGRYVIRARDFMNRAHLEDMNRLGVLPAHQVTVRLSKRGASP